MISATSQHVNIILIVTESLHPTVLHVKPHCCNPRTVTPHMLVGLIARQATVDVDEKELIAKATGDTL